MSIDLVVNELSWPSGQTTRRARELMSGLIQVVVTAGRAGVQRQLRTKANIEGALLAPDYPVAKWRNDPTVDLEERRFFATVATKAPFVGGSREEAVLQALGASEYRFNGAVAEGLGCADLLGSIAVSFETDAVWDCSQCAVEVQRLEDEDLVQDVVEVPHASRPAHIGAHRRLIELRCRPEVSSGAEVWRVRKQLFPNLIFCSEVERQLEAITAGFEPVLGRLLELESVARRWTSGPFDPSQVGSKATPESQATIDKYGSERVFTCPEAGPVMFSWHLRITPNAWRVFFDPREPGKLCVGYIGPKLRTVRYSG